jgi:hypothetical protein
MKRCLPIVVAALVVAVAFPAFAGEKHHKKCDGDPQECLAKMHAKLSKKAWLGIEMDGTDDGRWKITRVVPDSPAEKAGFEKGGEEYTKKNKEGMHKVWSEVSPGSAATYVVLRKGGKLKLKAELDHVPDYLMAQWIGEHMLKSHLEAPAKVAKK